MLNNKGSAGTTVVLVIFLIIAVSVAVILYYPPAKPAKDFLATYIPGITDIVPSDEAVEIDRPMPPVDTSNKQNTVPGTGVITQQPAMGDAQQPVDQSAQADTDMQTDNTTNSLSVPGFLTRPFGMEIPQIAGGTSDQKPTETAAKTNSPADVLKACISKLKTRDIIGAERFVSNSGKEVTLNGMTGIHKLLLKNIIDNKIFDEIGYNDAKISGQTCWIPLYTYLDGKNKMVGLYIILANRGDGWLVDDLYNPGR